MEARLGRTLVIGGVGRAARDFRLILLTHSELRRALRGTSREEVDQQALISDFPAAITAQENALVFRFVRKARIEASWRFWCDLHFHSGLVAIADLPAMAVRGFVPYPTWVCNQKCAEIAVSFGEALTPVMAITFRVILSLPPAGMKGAIAAAIGCEGHVRAARESRMPKPE